jgi:hypothetical protein
MLCDTRMLRVFVSRSEKAAPSGMTLRAHELYTSLAVVATYLPACGETRIEPIIALRAE